jgi:hypothetical protein
MVEGHSQYGCMVVTLHGGWYLDVTKVIRLRAEFAEETALAQDTTAIVDCMNLLLKGLPITGPPWCRPRLSDLVIGSTQRQLHCSHLLACIGLPYLPAAAGRP